MLVAANNPHAMGTGRNEFANSATESGCWVDCEYWDLILSVFKSLFELYDRQEVGTGRTEEVR